MDITNSDFKFYIVKNIFIFFKLEKKYNIKTFYCGHLNDNLNNIMVKKNKID